jgi:PGF-pre-PGF domain-containing protein/PGF-CTERM protein
LETDEEIDTIAISVSGAEGALLGFDNITKSGSGPYTYTASYSATNDGDYTVTLDTAADAVDNDGADSESDTVIVDTSAPSITNVSLDNDGSDNLELSFESDTRLDNEPTDVSVSVDGPKTEDVYTFAGPTDFGHVMDNGTYTYTLATTQAYGDDGTYTATVDDAVDDAGNNGGTNGTGSGLNDTYWLDTTAPSEITISNPEDGDRVTSQGTIEGTAVDNIEVSAVNLTIQRDSDGTYWNGTTWKSTKANVSASADSGNFNSNLELWSFDSSAITADGEYNVTASVIDAVGNTNQSTTTTYTLYTQRSRSGSPGSSSSSSSSSSSAADDDDTDDTEVEGASIEHEESATPEVDEEAGTSTSTFSENSDVESVTFDSTDVYGDVTTRRLSSEPEETGPSPGTSVRVTEISVPDNAVDTSATIRMRVTTDRLEEVDASSDQLRINRYNDDEGEWQTLETRVTDENADEVMLEADTPGFSYFSVSAVLVDSFEDEATGVGTDVETNATDDTTEDDTPGFGISVALFALVGSLLMVRRKRL